MKNRVSVYSFLAALLCAHFVPSVVVAFTSHAAVRRNRGSLKSNLQAAPSVKDFMKTNDMESWDALSSILKEAANNNNNNNAALEQVLKQQYDALMEIWKSVLSLELPSISSSEGFDFSSTLKQQLLTLMGTEELSPYIIATIPAVVLVATVLAASNNSNQDVPIYPYPNKRYDAESSKLYFQRQPIQVLQRALQIAFLSGGFGLSLALDYTRGKLFDKEDERAFQLAKTLTILGPSFIKIGQSLSIRTDLLRPAYVRGLQSLQDQVPPFDTEYAKEILKKELKVSDLDKVFSYISEEPVAAASLGQVYKAVLKESGKTVAIKVQRPNIMNLIALDMYLIKEAAYFIKRINRELNSDLPGTVDAWGIGFVDELNYVDEALNAEQFTESIQTTPLRNVVFAPPVIQEYSTDKVLVTEWVEGERLDRSSQSDVTTLCSIAMNTYLTMMLETGVLHCDPHPGNLLRTPDGKLCVLDWGMVTRLDSSLQVTLVEHMAHLTSADYEEIPRDLLLLGFIPESKADLIEDSGVVEVLADIYSAWTRGGGAASVNVNQVIAQLQDLTAQKGNLFQIPPYFAYIAKSFSVLEGIGLMNSPSYSIINECLPYVSKRLLTDPTDKSSGALSTFIFGPNKYDENRFVDYDRVEQLVTGFSDYTTSTKAGGDAMLLAEQGVSRTKLLEDAADQILDILIVEEETPLQSIVLEQLAKIVAATTRSAFEDVRKRTGILDSGRTFLGSLLDPLGFFRTSPIVQKSKADEGTLETTRKLIELFQSQIIAEGNEDLNLSTLSNAELGELASVLVNNLWARRVALYNTNSRFLSKLLQITANRLEKGEREGTPQYGSAPLGSEEGEQQQATSSSSLESSRSSARVLRAKSLLAEIEKDDQTSKSSTQQEAPQPVKY